MKKLLGRAALRIAGWTIEGESPEARKFVLIAAPHTSNLDLPLMIFYAWVFGIDISWLGKKSLFKPPFGWFMKALGGIPVDRSASHDLVSQVAQRLQEADYLALAVPPSGTRSYRDHWKSGFYYIAVEAGVPIVMSILDWGHKRGGIGPAFYPTGDVRADMDEIRKFYAGATGRFPDQVSRIVLKAELEAEDSAASEPPAA